MNKTIAKKIAELRYELYLGDVSAGAARPDKDHDGSYKSAFSLTEPVHALIHSEGDLVILGAQCEARSQGGRWCTIQYFGGFDDTKAPPFESLTVIRKSRIMKTIAQRKKAKGIYTIEDGYEETRSLKINYNYKDRLPAHTSAEWHKVKRDFMSLDGFLYMEVTFPNKTIPQAAFSRDLQFICSYEALMARNDFDKLMAEAGIVKKEVIAANNQKKIVFSHNGVPISMLEAFLRIQGKAFFRDLARAKPHLIGRIKKLQGEYESSDIIPLYIRPTTFKGSTASVAGQNDLLEAFDLRNKTFTGRGAKYR